MIISVKPLNEGMKECPDGGQSFCLNGGKCMFIESLKEPSCKWVKNQAHINLRKFADDIDDHVLRNVSVFESSLEANKTNLQLKNSPVFTLPTKKRTNLSIDDSMRDVDEMKHNIFWKEKR